MDGAWVDNIGIQGGICEILNISINVLSTQNSSKANIYND